MSKLVWATKAEGLIKYDGEVYSNHDFIQVIKNDRSSMGSLMRSRFPQDIEIKLGGGIPKGWVPWSYNDSIDEDFIVSQLSVIPVPEIEPQKRLHVKRGEVSERIKKMSGLCNFTVGNRGITDNGFPDSVNKAIISIIAISYLLMEKNTTASLMKSSSTISISKKKKLSSALNIVTGDASIAEVSLIDAYMEPSLMMSVRLYCISAIYGTEETKSIIDNIYRKVFAEQISSVISIAKHQH